MEKLFVYLSRYWRDDVVDVLRRGLEQQPAVSLRLNPARHVQGICPEGLTLAALSDDDLAATVEGYDGRVPWCRDGIYLSQRPAFTADPLMHAGTYYVQEASSMFIAHALRHTPLYTSQDGSTDGLLQCRLALDLCAAPGGKSTLLRSMLPTQALLICNEPVRARAQVLAENIAKWRAPNTIVTNDFPQNLIPRLTSPAATSQKRDKRDKASKRGKVRRGTSPVLFDIIVCDVPCSGEGMFRKEEEAVRQWSPQLVGECAALQRQIVSTAWQALRPGGVLVYSTCTFNPVEDEHNVIALCHQLGAHVIDIPIPQEWGVRSFIDIARPETIDELTPQERQWAAACYHLIPGNVRGEGFFCAVLAKPTSDDSTEPDASIVSAYASAISANVSAPSHDDVLSLSLSHGDLPSVTPSHGDLPSVDLSLDEAMRYLQRESLVLPPDTPLGIVQVCHRGQPLGLMKNIGSRANNLYPKEWRIRSSHLQPHTILHPPHVCRQ